MIALIQRDTRPRVALLFTRYCTSASAPPLRQPGTLCVTHPDGIHASVTLQHLPDEHPESLVPDHGHAHGVHDLPQSFLPEQ